MCCTKLEPGDLVLVRQKAFLEKHKIQDRWENESYTVLEQVRPDALIFRVARDGEAKSRTLHRNMLLPLLQRVESDSVVDNQPGNASSPVPNEIGQSQLVEDEKDPLSDGPVTRGKAKMMGLCFTKANQFMHQLFDA